MTHPKIHPLVIVLFTFFISIFISGKQYALAHPGHEKVSMLPEIKESEIIQLETFGSQAYSPIIDREKPFNTIIIRSKETLKGLMVNTNPGQQEDWKKIELKNEGYGAENIIFTKPTKKVHLKLKNPSQNTTEIELEFHLFDANPIKNKQLSGIQLTQNSSPLIKRSEWGANESLRYWTPELEEKYKDYKAPADPCADLRKKYKSDFSIKNTVKSDLNGELLWPLQYSDKVEKIFIHHTGSELKDLNGDAFMDRRDYEAIVRAIYHYHTVSRGWGDIGYHYLIDPLGNIYEGKAGGDKVVAGHALCHNNGSIGIAILGNYEENKLPTPALNSLIKLVNEKTKEHNIEPKGNSIFRGKIMPNILGHKDVMATACPGQNLYGALPKLREQAAFNLRKTIIPQSNSPISPLDYNAKYSGESIEINLKPLEKRRVTLNFKNTGRKNWDKNTWLHVEVGSKNNSKIIPLVDGKSFVAADLKQDQVRPGSIGQFEVEVEGGFTGGVHNLKLTPVINGLYKMTKATTVITTNTKNAEFGYELVNSNLPEGEFFQGEDIQASIQLRNTGNTKWYNYGSNPIQLGTEAFDGNKRDRKSLFIKSARIGYLLETEVKPGEVGTFIFDLQVPSNYEGVLEERFTPVIEQVTWLENKNLGFDIDIKKPVHRAEITKKTADTTLRPGEKKRVSITIKNNGDLKWNQDNMELNIRPRKIKAFTSSLSPSSEINPKESETFSFWIQAPYSEGSHSVYFNSRFNNKIIRGGSSRFTFNVETPKITARRTKKSNSTIKMNPGEIQEIEVQFKNTGNIIWNQKGPNAIYLAPSKPQDRKSKLYYDQGWYSKFRAASLLESEVKPGEVGTFKFKIKPEERGIYEENFQLVIEKVGWIRGTLTKWNIQVEGEKVYSSESNSQYFAKQLIKNRTNVITDEDLNSQKNKEYSSNSIQSESQQLKPEGTVIQDPIRILLAHDSSSSSFTSSRSFSVSDGKNMQLQLNSNANLTVRKIGSQFRIDTPEKVIRSSIIRIIPEKNGVIEIANMERRPAWNKSLNDNQFRGIVEMRIIDNKTHYINEIEFVDYLKGVAEVSNSTAYEKMKVMAILARTYARFYQLKENEKFPGKPYDGSDNPDVFQKYLGYGYEKRSPNFTRAIQDTSQLVVTYKGQLIKTPYFNQSNGRTKSAQEVWGWSNTPYLKSVEDKYCDATTQLGHGVGLSGCGADGMAKAGKNFMEIIKYFYQGVEIEKFNVKN